MIFGAMALMLSFASCDQTQQEGPDFGSIQEDGFYVSGAATGIDGITADLMMAAGHNEAASNELRNGMFEKYIVLEGGKDFELVLNEAGTQTRYSATLADFDVTELADNPSIVVKRGELKIGADAPAMQVAKTGLYHIVLDLNNNADLLYPQIVVAPVQWGVRGGMNGWGFTAFPEPSAYSNTGITWVLEDQELAAGGKFKFAYGHGWKIQLDDAGNVKANTNLGEGAATGTADIAVEAAGKYKVTLNFALKGGAIENSYSYNVELTEASSMPTTMYVIGNDFGNWDWNAETVVEMAPVHSHGGAFWAVRYMTTATEFKFCSVREWNGDFCTLGTNTGFVTPGNNMVEADGMYMIYVDLANNFVTVEPAKVYGMGDVFGGWDAGKAENLFALEGQTLTATAPNAGNIRMYAAAPEGVSADWWRMEFNVFDGKIEYRGAGDDQAAVAVTAGQKVTLDFNAGTGSIQ